MLSNLVKLLKTSRFPEYSRLFLFANKSAYVALRVYQSYANEGDGYDSFRKSAINNCVDYLDKSIRTLEAIKKEAAGILPKVYTAAEIDPAYERNEILKSAQYFVRIEKAWDSLNELVGMIQRDINNMEESGKEKTAKEDAVAALKSIIGNADAGIRVLSVIKSKIAR